MAVLDVLVEMSLMYNLENTDIWCIFVIK